MDGDDGSVSTFVKGVAVSSNFFANVFSQIFDKYDRDFSNEEEAVVCLSDFDSDDAAEEKLMHYFPNLSEFSMYISDDDDDDDVSIIEAIDTPERNSMKEMVKHVNKVKQELCWDEQEEADKQRKMAKLGKQWCPASEEVDCIPSDNLLGFSTHSCDDSEVSIIHNGVDTPERKNMEEIVKRVIKVKQELCWDEQEEADKQRKILKFGMQRCSDSEDEEYRPSAKRRGVLREYCLPLNSKNQLSSYSETLYETDYETSDRSSPQSGIVSDDSDTTREQSLIERSEQSGGQEVPHFKEARKLLKPKRQVSQRPDSSVHQRIHSSSTPLHCSCQHCTSQQQQQQQLPTNGSCPHLYPSKAPKAHISFQERSPPSPHCSCPRCTLPSSHSSSSSSTHYSCSWEDSDMHWSKNKLTDSSGLPAPPADNRYGHSWFQNCPSFVQDHHKFPSCVNVEAPFLANQSFSPCQSASCVRCMSQSSQCHCVTLSQKSVSHLLVSSTHPTCYNNTPRPSQHYNCNGNFCSHQASCSCHMYSP